MKSIFYKGSIFLTLCLGIFQFQSFAQVGVGTTTPDSSAALHVVGNGNQGILIPTVADTAGLSFAAAQNGLLVYSIATNEFFYWNGATLSWQTMGGGSSEWLRNGNYVYVLSDSVGIGTTSPKEKLEIVGRLRLTGNSRSILENNTNPNREFLEIRGKSSTNNGAGINLYGDGDINYPGELRLYSGGSTRLMIVPEGSVGIGTTNPDTSAILDLRSTTKGLLIPRSDTGTMVNVIGPQLTSADDGMMIYAEDINAFAYWDGDSLDWYLLNENFGGPGSSDDDWYILGDTIYHGKNFVRMGTPGNDSTVKVEIASYVRTGLRLSAYGDGTYTQGLAVSSSGSSNYNVGIESKAYGNVTDTTIGLNAEVYSAGIAGVGVRGSVQSGGNNSVLYGVIGEIQGNPGDTTYGILGSASGGTLNFAGYFADGNVVVQDTLVVGGNSFGPGAILQSADGSGKLTWAAPGAAADADWTIAGDSIYNIGAKIGIGTATPVAKLEVNPGFGYTGMVAAFINNDNTSGSPTVNATSNGNGPVINVSQTGFGSALSIAQSNAASGTNAAYISTNGNGSSGLRIDHNGGVAGSTDVGLFSNNTGVGNVNMAGYFNAANATTNWAGFFDLGNVYIRDTLVYNNSPASPGAPYALMDTIGNGRLVWMPVGGGGGASWEVTGNSGLGEGDFVGTLDKVNLHFKTNNVEGMILDTNGKVGIGTGIPAARFEVNPPNTYVGTLGQFHNENSGNGNAVVQIMTNAFGTGLYLQQTGGGQGFYLNHNNTSGSTNAARISTNGRNNASLEVTHTGATAGSVDYGLDVQVTGGGNINYGAFYSATGANVNWAGYFNKGNVYIGDTLFLPTGAASGNVLTSDATGKAYWAPPAGAGAFSTTANVTSNAPGDYTTDDFVFGSPQLNDDADANHDRRFFFDKSTGAFRAGFVTGTQWDSRGNASIGLGANVSPSGNVSVAIGESSTATAYSSIAIGSFSDATKNYATAIGRSARADAPYSTAIGYNAYTVGDFSTALGENVTSYSYGETTVGLNSKTYTPSSYVAFDSTDRVFSVGNGTTTASRHNAMTIYKNGTVNINEAYNLPTDAGVANYVLTTDGAGTTSWEPATGGADGDWTINGDSIYNLTSKFGIGLNTPAYKLDVFENTSAQGPAVNVNLVTSAIGSVNNAAVFGKTTGSGPGGYYGGQFQVDGVGGSSSHIAVLGQAFSTSSGWNIGGDMFSNGASGGTNVGLYAFAQNGATNYAGYFGDGNVYVQDTLIIPTGAAAGAVLTSDATGKATWQPAASGPGAGFEARASVAQSLTISGMNQIAFGTEIYDDGGNFAGNAYTAPTDGFYHFDASVRLMGYPTSDQYLYITFQVNGGLRKNVAFPSSTAQFAPSISADMKLNAGDVVTVNIYTTYTSGSTSFASSNVWFNGHRIY